MRNKKEKHSYFLSEIRELQNSSLTSAYFVLRIKNHYITFCPHMPDASNNCYKIKCHTPNIVNPRKVLFFPQTPIYKETCSKANKLKDSKKEG